MVWTCAVGLGLALVSGWTAGAAWAQSDYEREPIDYRKAVPRDRVAGLQHGLEQGTVKLGSEAKHGYLSALLRELGISEKSQTLVFSRTSLQRTRISPNRPRALYFNDDTYLGWVQHGDLIEIASVDPRLGSIFYSLNQQPVDRPRIVRQHDDCLQCHASSMTAGVPGLMVRSVFPSASGNPILSAGSFRTTYQSPLAERWGGWYVTGTHGAQRHMGNAILRGDEGPEQLDRGGGANITDLSSRFDVRPYLTPHSDIVALMVLEHQTPSHNQFTQASYQAQLALRDQQVLNQMAGKPADEPIDSIDGRYQHAADKVLEVLLFAGEAPLAGTVQGTSEFTAYFESLGPHDRLRRSLRQFDLKSRLFKYPCSYLIYSSSFNGLPAAVKDRVYRRLWRYLKGEESPKELPGLSRAERRAILEILLDTKPDLPPYWRS